MRPPRFRLRTLLIAVAIAALVSLVASHPYRQDGITDKRVVIPIASVVAAAYGLGSMSRPLAFLAPLLVAWIVTPQVDHPRPDFINVSAGGCALGWIIGAPAGWISRCLTRPSNSPPSLPSPPTE
jgi:peptidoglycan/LPS O-acetylase OafA/YrhL